MHNTKVQIFQNFWIEKPSRNFPETLQKLHPESTQNPENPNVPLLGNDQKWKKHRTPIGAITSPSVHATRPNCG